MLSLDTKKFCFIFNGKLYSYVNGVAMCSHLSSTLGNAFIVYFEKSWLQSCLSDCRRYVDDIFVFSPYQNI